MYELLVVSKISDTDGLLLRVEKVLKDANSLELKLDKLGKKQLAYPIKKQTEADYTVLTFSVGGDAIGNLTDMLRLEQEALLRYLIIKQKIRKPRKKHRVQEAEVKEKVEASKPKVTVVTKKVISDPSVKVRARKGKVESGKKVSKGTRAEKGKKES